MNQAKTTMASMMVFVGLLSVGCAGSGVVSPEYSKSLVGAKDESALTVGEYLNRIAADNDCYYTLEQGRPYDSAESLYAPLQKEKVLWPKEKMDLEGHLKYLSEHLENFTWWKNASCPAVVHVADSRILKLKDYPIDASVVNFGCSGGFGSLANDLTKRLPLLCEFNVDQYLCWEYDHSSPEDIPFQKQIEVRDLLTDFVRLGTRRRCVWEAWTDVDNRPGSPGWATMIWYWSPMPTSEEAANLDLEHEAERALLLNADYLRYVKMGKQGVAEAVDFIRKHELNAPRTSQVRWALRALGDMKAEESIPVLLHYMEWEYAPWIFPDEQYPAVYALCRIGEPAVSAILPLIGSEENELRRRLMCFILLKVRGRKAAIEALNILEVNDKSAEGGLRIAYLRAFAITIPGYLFEPFFTDYPQ